MDDAVAINAPIRERAWTRLRKRVRASAPARVETALAVLSGALLVFSFPDFNLWPLAWVGLVPLFLAIARRPGRGRAFLLGWMTGTLFFYGSCYWLTHAMIRYGGIPAWIAFILIIPPTVIAGLFPAICSMALARVVARWGARALFIAPLLWATLEWTRLGAIGQLWNAIGYSQAYVPTLIQTARWGGVYMVGFLIVMVNAAIAYALLQRNARALKVSAAAILCVTVIIFLSLVSRATTVSERGNAVAVVVAVQPNVPMDQDKSLAEVAELTERHYSLSERGLLNVSNEFTNLPRIVIWPESPMYFSYAQDSAFRELVARFAAKNRTSVLFNSQEPAPAGGTYNSAVMVNEEGRLVAQYDKIRLLPFGEYVPLPRWLPGVSLIPVMVGDFTPGAQYTLMPLGEARAGVFICFESAFPSISRAFAEDGADVLVNISNDGYLGQTPVMRQHLANTVFRAVENGRPVVRATNTGITAFITERGEVTDATEGFRPDVRTWVVRRQIEGKTFYTRFGDVFVGLCALISLIVAVISWRKREPKGVAG
ncbi:MAG: apolipoprotein N-acyltransferase [Acidobacteriota bacterium]|jgi:apolipoprotein N-acyltransferase|nr:apolipoprotein N-acyltransferase [Acidobacteriota bacterium]